MSNFVIKNNTTGRTNTFTPGAVTIPGYTQAGAVITASSLVNSAVEGFTSGYASGGVDVGNSFCAVYNDFPLAGSAGSLSVSNYSSCTIVMCGGGGGGSGSPAGTPAGRGGSGGITIYKNIPLSGVTNINYSVGSAGNGGVGHRARPLRNATPGNSGNATTVTISSTTYTANGGIFGQTSGGKGADGTITPSNPTTYPTAALNSAVTYQTTPNKVISVPYSNGIALCGIGGEGGFANGTNGNAGVAGGGGFVRIYLYP